MMKSSSSLRIAKTIGFSLLLAIIFCAADVSARPDYIKGRRQAVSIEEVPTGLGGRAVEIDEVQPAVVRGRPSDTVVIQTGHRMRGRPPVHNVPVLGEIIDKDPVGIDEYEDPELEGVAEVQPGEGIVIEGGRGQPAREVEVEVPIPIKPDRGEPIEEVVDDAGVEVVEDDGESDMEEVEPDEGPMEEEGEEEGVEIEEVPVDDEEMSVGHEGEELDFEDRTRNQPPAPQGNHPRKPKRPFFSGVPAFQVGNSSVTPTPTPTPTGTTKKPDKLSAGLIALIVILALAVVAAIIGLCLGCTKKKEEVVEVVPVGGNNEVVVTEPLPPGNTTPA